MKVSHTVKRPGLSGHSVVLLVVCSGKNTGFKIRSEFQPKFCHCSCNVTLIKFINLTELKVLICKMKAGKLSYFTA